MTARKVNNVKLNIGVHGNGDLPKPGEPVVTIDGQPLHAVTAVAFSAGHSEFTLVTVTLEATVEGEVIVTTLSNVKDEDA